MVCIGIGDGSGDGNCQIRGEGAVIGPIGKGAFCGSRKEGWGRGEKEKNRQF
jgi:hypothetical protein